MLEPVGANYVERFYRCGTHLAPFRAVPGAGSAAPGPFQGEDWVGSTTEVVGGSGGLGPSVLADGRRLVDAVRDDPVGFLGAEHLARFGPDTGLLVKLLDAGERLPVHLHPDREFARRHLDCPHGKTEAWVVLEAPPDGTVHLGFVEQIAPDVLAGWVATQDTDRLLASMNSFPVAPGDTVLVPAGLPHALGAGVFVVELQEPTDWSILLEWAGTARRCRSGGCAPCATGPPPTHSASSASSSRRPTRSSAPSWCAATDRSRPRSGCSSRSRGR